MARASKKKVYVAEAELPKKPKVSVLAPDGKHRAEISYYDVHDYPALGRLDVATIWETKTPEVQLEIINAAIWYGFTGQKPKVSPEAQASLDKLIEPIKKSRSQARKAKIKAALKEQALGGRIEIDIDDDTGADMSTGEVYEAQEQAAQTEPTVAPPPPLPPPTPAKVATPPQSPTPTTQNSPVHTQRATYWDPKAGTHRYVDNNEIVDDDRLPF